MSSRVAFSLLGFAAAQTDGLRFYAPVQPALQQALQPTAGLAYPRPVAVDALQPPVFVDAAPAGPSGAEVACFAAAFGALGFAAARHAAKPAAGQAPATGNGELVAAPAASALAPVAMLLTSATGKRVAKSGKIIKGSGGRIPQTAITPGDIGTTKPLGVFDPLQLMNKMPDKYRRWQEMEIKHGRFAMAACLHVFVTEAGFRWPGYLSLAEDIKFSDMPGGTIASWAALPNLAWAQIVLIVALFDNSILAQDPGKDPGDVAGDFWVRYEDKPGQQGKEWKLNAERNNGRAAMMGILGMIIHEGLTGNPLFPIPVPEQPILEDALDIERGPARVGSFVLVSLGMAFAGIIGAIPEFGKQDAEGRKAGRA